MNEHLDFVNTADTLSKAGGRALGAVISKIHSYKICIVYFIEN